MKQQRAYQSGCAIALLGMMVLASVGARADDDYNIYSRLKELRQEQSLPLQTATSDWRVSESSQPAASRGVQGPIRSELADGVGADQERDVWHSLGGIGGIDTN
jgi:hypothetical protein